MDININTKKVIWQQNHLVKKVILSPQPRAYGFPNHSLLASITVPGTIPPAPHGAGLTFNQKGICYPDKHHTTLAPVSTNLPGRSVLQ